MQDPSHAACPCHFCHACLTLWSQTNPTCPTCRAKFTPPDIKLDPAYFKPPIPTVACPHPCCGAKTPLNEMKAHIDQCGFQQLKCKYAKYGCTYTGAKADHEAHLNDGSCSCHKMAVTIDNVRRIEGAVGKVYNMMVHVENVHGQHRMQFQHAINSINQRTDTSANNPALMAKPSTIFNALELGYTSLADPWRMHEFRMAYRLMVGCAQVMRSPIATVKVLPSFVLFAASAHRAVNKLMNSEVRESSDGARTIEGEDYGLVEAKAFCSVFVMLLATVLLASIMFMIHQNDKEPPTASARQIQKYTFVAMSGGVVMLHVFTREAMLAATQFAMMAVLNAISNAAIGVFNCNNLTTDNDVGDAVRTGWLYGFCAWLSGMAFLDVISYGMLVQYFVGKEGWVGKTLTEVGLDFHPIVWNMVAVFRAVVVVSKIESMHKEVVKGFYACAVFAMANFLWRSGDWGGVQLGQHVRQEILNIVQKKTVQTNSKWVSANVSTRLCLAVYLVGLVALTIV